MAETQTDDVKKDASEIDVQTEDTTKQSYSVNTQTDTLAKHTCNVKVQTIENKTKERSTDTAFIQAEEAAKARVAKAETAEVDSNSDKNNSSQKSEESKIKKPALFLDTLSSPSDGGSHKNADGGQNVLTEKTPSTSKTSNAGYNKRDLNYMLNRDPMKEFFHLTLQSIRMNSPHMNQILSIDGEKFYK